MNTWTRTSRYALVFAGAISLSLSAYASCKHPRCSRDVDEATTSTVPVIVQYTNDPTDDEVGAVGNIGSVYNRMHTIRAIAARVPASRLTALANRPGVAHIFLDHPVAARQQVTPIGTSPEFTAEPVNAPWAISRNFDGRGIGVAVIDSGITPSVDFAPKVVPVAPPATLSAATVAANAVNALVGPKGLVVSALSGPAGQNTPAAATTAPAAYLGPNRIVFSYNFTSTTATDTMDAFGHGTHVAGLIAGNGSSSAGPGYSRTFTGIAPSANLINLRVLDANGQGTDSEVIAAIETAIYLKDVYNIKVINLSLGRPIYESYTLDPLCQAVEQAWKAGIVVVVAAGNEGRNLALNNEGYGTIEAPGNDPYVITVGAANPMNTAAVSDDVMASYSSKGPTFIDDISKPDLIAPGNLVTSVLAPNSNLQLQNPAFYTPQNWYVNNGLSTASTAYFPLSGTSMATAVVSGAVADLMQVAGYLTPDQVKVLLMSSANKNVIPQTNTVTDPVSGTAYTAHNDVFTQGAGYLDLQATINNTWNYGYTIPASGYAMSPVATYDTATGDVTLVTDATALWGRSSPEGTTALWGASSVFGQNAFVTNGDTALWGATALWGRSDPQAFTALWGATALWGRATPDAATALWGRSDTSAAGTTSGNTALWGREQPDTF